jgi:hypothetical protein
VPHECRIGAVATPAQGLRNLFARVQSMRVAERPGHGRPRRGSESTRATVRGCGHPVRHPRDTPMPVLSRATTPKIDSASRGPKVTLVSVSFAAHSRGNSAMAIRENFLRALQLNLGPPLVTYPPRCDT